MTQAASQSTTADVVAYPTRRKRRISNPYLRLTADLPPNVVSLREVGVEAMTRTPTNLILGAMLLSLSPKQRRDVLNAVGALAHHGDASGISALRFMLTLGVR